MNSGLPKVKKESHIQRFLGGGGGGGLLCPPSDFFVPPLGDLRMTVESN